MKKTDTMYYNDVIYSCYDGKYYRGWRDGKHCILHIDVWENHNGPIPKGYDVHHKDEDKTNNDIDNLELLTRSEHTARHHQLGSLHPTPINMTDEEKRLKRNEYQRLNRPSKIKLTPEEISIRISEACKGKKKPKRTPEHVAKLIQSRKERRNK